MIAAVALANDLPIYTCNVSDFREIDGLVVVDVPIGATDPGEGSGSASIP